MQEKITANRKAEKRWRVTGLQIHKDIFRSARNRLAHIINQSKSSYYRTEIEKCSKDQKKLFSLVNNLLNKSKTNPLPAHESIDKLVSTFSDFFIAKIDVIRSNIDAQIDTPSSLTLPVSSCDADPCSFAPTTPDEVRKVIMKSKSSSCELDALPTPMLKSCLDSLLPSITPLLLELYHLK